MSAQDISCSATVTGGLEGTSNNTDGITGTNCTMKWSGLQGGTNIVTVNEVDYYKLGGPSAYVQLVLSAGKFYAGDILTATVTSNGGDSEKTVNVKVGDTNETGTVSVNSNETKNIIYTLKAKDIESDGSIKIYRGSSAPSNLRVAKFSVTGSRGASIYAADASIKATASGVEVTKDIAVTGMFLAGTTLTATLSPAVPGLSVSLASNTITDGEISTTATLHYTQTENAKGSTTLILSDGTTVEEVAVSYQSSVVSWSLQSVSSAITWDWSKIMPNTESTVYVSANKRIELTESTTPAIDEEIVYENYNGDMFTIASGFDGTSIAFTGQIPASNNGFCMNGVIRFTTTVPGTIVVKFTDTGTGAKNNAVKRYLKVNGVNTEYWTSRENNSTDPAVAYAAQLNVVSGAIPVEAGDVTITGSSAIQVIYVTFTPATETATISAAKYATYVPTMKVAVPDDVSAYKVSATATEATLTPLTVIRAGEPVVIYKDVDAATEVTFTATSADASDVTGNELHVSATDVTADGTQYVLAKPDGKEIGFYKAASGTTIAAGKAYLVSPSGAPCFVFNFDGSATGIEAVEAAKSFDGAFYNLAGQRVSQPTRGLYIVNGKKVVIK